jgi:hypothetical protein
LNVATRNVTGSRYDNDVSIDRMTHSVFELLTPGAADCDAEHACTMVSRPNDRLSQKTVTSVASPNG